MFCAVSREIYDGASLKFYSSKTKDFKNVCNMVADMEGASFHVTSRFPQEHEKLE